MVDPTAIPLSGARFSIGGTLRYNFNVVPTRRNYASVFWDESLAMLSESARQEVPSAQASDYDYRLYGFEIGRDFASGPERPRSTLALRATRSYFGGDPFSDDLRLRFVQQRNLRDGQQLVWSAAVARNERKDNAIRSSTIGVLLAQWTLPLPSGDTLAWFAGVERQSSESAAIANDAARLGLTWTKGEPVMGAELSLGLVGEYRNFDRALYGPEPREDRSLALSASLFFSNLDAYGFAPKLTVTADRTNSNISLFETEEIGLSIGIESVF